MIKIISFSKFTNIQSQSASRYTPQKGNCRKTETRQTECTEKIKIINPLKRFLICGCCCWILLLHLPSSLSFCQPFGNRCPCIAHTQRCQVGFPRCVGSSPCRPICYIYIQLVCFFFCTYIYYLCCQWSVRWLSSPCDIIIWLWVRGQSAANCD